MPNKKYNNSKNVMILIVSLLLTISLLTILTIYTFQTVIVSKKIDKTLENFKNSTLEILLPNQTYTNVNINLITNYLPKGELISGEIVINELIITNNVKSGTTIINAQSREDITKALNASLDKQYMNLQLFLKDNNRSLIILFLFFSVFIFVVCVVSININNNTLAKTQHQSREVETRMLFTLTEGNRSLDNTTKTIRDEYNELIKELKKDNKVYLLLSKGLLEIANKNYDGAIKLYSEALSMDFLNSDIYSSRAHAYIEKRMYTESIDDLNKAISMRYDVEEDYYARASIHKIRKEWHEAIEDYTKTIALNQSHINAYFYRALSYYNIEEYDNALNDFNKIIELDCNNYKAYSNRGYIHTKFYENTTNKLFLEKALEDLNKAVEIKPTSVITLVHFAYLYMCYYKIENKKGYITKAKNYLDEAEAIDSENKQLCYYYGMYYILTNKQSKALKLISKSAEMGYDEAIRYMFNNNSKVIED